MGRDITGLRIDKNPNNVSNSNGINHAIVRVTPRIAAESVEETDSNADDGNSLGALLSSSAASVSPHFAAEKEHSGSTNAENIKIASPLASRKPVRADGNQYHDEEDNLSLASSVAASVRSTVSRVTVPVAPKFACNDRLSRRREFYSKLEEKHKALQAEKVEVAARTKEEEETAIKQLRKTAVYKANPVPSFYREGPPPKVELKKLPVTRAKSPNLSRRKSCGDAVNVSSSSSPNEKCNNNCDRIKRHSIGTGNITPLTTTTTHRNKKPSFSLNSNSTTPKTKDAIKGSRYSSSRSSKDGIFTPTPVKTKSSVGKNGSRKCVKEVKDMSLKVADMSKTDCVAEVKETMASPTALKDKIRIDTDIRVVEDDDDDDDDDNVIETKAIEQKIAGIDVET